MKIILASQSPRRNEILRNLGIPFEKRTSSGEEVNEPRHENETPADLACHNALLKAKDVAAGLSLPGNKVENDGDYIIIGSDTIVVEGGHVLPKPVDEEDAARMLRKLSGKPHSVITAVALVRTSGAGVVTEEVTGYEETRVFFRELDEEDIKTYISTGEPMDKAGAYGIQGRGAFLVDRIEGDFFNVVGLPVMKLYRMMLGVGVDLFEISAGKS